MAGAWLTDPYRCRGPPRHGHSPPPAARLPMNSHTAVFADPKGSVQYRKRRGPTPLSTHLCLPPSREKPQQPRASCQLWPRSWRPCPWVSPPAALHRATWGRSSPIPAAAQHTFFLAQSLNDPQQPELGGSLKVYPGPTSGHRIRPCPKTRTGALRYGAAETAEAEWGQLSLGRNCWWLCGRIVAPPANRTVGTWLCSSPHPRQPPASLAGPFSRSTTLKVPF